MNAIKQKIRQLVGIYRSQIYEMTDIIDRSTLYDPVLKLITNYSMGSNFRLVSDLEKAVKNKEKNRSVPLFQEYKEIGLACLYGAGAVDKDTNIIFFELYNAEDYKEMANRYFNQALDCRTDGLSGKNTSDLQKKQIEFYLENMDDIIKIVTNIKFASDYGPYNFRSYSCKKIAAATGKINAMDDKIRKNNVMDVAKTAKKPLSYLICKYAGRGDYGQTKYTDRYVESAVTGFLLALKRKGSFYRLIPEGELIFSHHPCEEIGENGKLSQTTVDNYTNEVWKIQDVLMFLENVDKIEVL